MSVLGLGQMGTAIAERLVDAGHSVTVWNRTPGKAIDLVARGATELENPKAAWNSDVVFTMLADSAALNSLMIDGFDLVSVDEARGKFLIDMSTVSPESSERVAKDAAANGIRFLRAPVSGNPAVVRGGNLAIVVSGAQADFDAMRSVLSDVGPNVFLTGEGEAARFVKLALNLMIAGTAQLLAEAITLAEAHGVQRADLLEIMGASAAGSPFVKYKTSALLTDDYTSTFSTRLMRKDLDLILDAAAAGGVPQLTAVRVAVLNHCRYTASHRCTAASANGASEAELAAVAQGDYAQFTERERVALRLTDEMTTVLPTRGRQESASGLSTHMRKELEQTFDPTERVELTMSIGVWNALARFHRVMDFDLDMPEAPASVAATL